MRFPEGPAHGFFTLSDAKTKRKLAHGELVQWLEKRVIASRLSIRFDDGSLYDETVRFTQRPSFRITSYELTQKGPAFDEDQRVTFDASGRYDVRQRKHGAEEKRASGTTEIPDDVANGLTSVLAKNLPEGASGAAHLLTFRPEPLLLDLTITPQGREPYWVGGARSLATRFVIEPDVPGVKGVLATIVGKEPPTVRMWIAPEPAPVLVRFEGALYVDGPEWRMDLSAPRWTK
ncbi:hypothetical protein K2Z84_09685 [Candidatus Binatia bacterium]|jgi:hypothetical protein|nr:hypothetical protein [Candidatus Binatia bacterium]